ncbi:NADH dehydrogenase subunit 1 (mitochondrion) [Anopheles gambiae]|uniref:NADH-ubiquinone oxidoreductase chain 1 n=6 Tax=gambiae species complex TaxID=44542 RepID=NU1M_ANOGA|nr:NADH dehydrogenase subunit 1 [Anopheles gambiae]P34846.1 RecName: Full=NADH-ubiquinone oxidoreductase chain 1; AltName: Full=NADH dehydrogenase subunit 1 [Anopheles gambiae]AAD12202.1 NADH dehydrogenase subunit 1 [Anopheles gambiae]AVM84818.1 NADH dehydrogenase subunit 1 [Anopheles gambiae]AVM84857.1 NADH dehydrogenase subunit 1 [Anopheles gambiae]AVM84870.1 NADH dehydrogenase subunit 1 [Anopheles gambiae]AVM84883.1 NADH dehydrogenase subunit 1 [Anopheles gambiae]
MFDGIMPLIGSLLLVICVMVGVAFLTLLERKVLGYIQIRKGPNKVGFNGLLQPFSDAVKLFTKEQTYPLLSNYISYYFSPVFSLFLSLLIWMCIPYLIKLYSFNLGVLFFLCCTSLGVYTVMIAGWSSNSNYALLGGLRAVAQTISYEVSLALILLSFIFLVGNYNFLSFYFYQDYVWFIFFCFPLGLVWLASCLAETNRTPFDFAEGESELVSGFNVEYSSGGFALIFLAEYSSILFMSMLFVVIFLGSDIYSFMFFLKLSFISFIFIWVRGTLPRFRYDKLMYLAWKSFLPLSLNYLFFFVGLKIFFISLLF